MLLKGKVRLGFTMHQLEYFNQLYQEFITSKHLRQYLPMVVLPAQ